MGSAGGETDGPRCLAEDHKPPKRRHDVKFLKSQLQKVYFPAKYCQLKNWELKTFSGQACPHLHLSISQYTGYYRKRQAKNRQYLIIFTVLGTQAGWGNYLSLDYNYINRDYNSKRLCNKFSMPKELLDKFFRKSKASISRYLRLQ